MSMATTLNHIACDEIAQERYGEVFITGLREVLFKCSFCLQKFEHYDKFLEHIFAHYDGEFLPAQLLSYTVKADVPNTSSAPIPRDIITKATIVPPTTVRPVEPSPQMPSIKFIPLRQEKALEGLKRSYALNVLRNKPELPVSNLLQFDPVNCEQSRAIPVVIASTVTPIEEQPDDVDAPFAIASAEQPVEILGNSALNAQTPAPIPRDIITKATIVPPTTVGPVEPSPQMPSIKFIPLRQEKALEGLKRSYALNVLRNKPELPVSNLLQFEPVNCEQSRAIPVVIASTVTPIEEQPDEVDAPLAIASAEQPLEILANSALNAQTPLTMIAIEPVLATTIRNVVPTDVTLPPSLLPLEDNVESLVSNIANTMTSSNIPQQRQSPKKEPRVPRSTTTANSSFFKSKWREGWFKCDICSGAHNTATGLMHHRRRHLGDARYQCCHCEMKFYTRKERDTHEARHTDAGYAYKCQYCGVGYDAQFCFQSHELRHRMHSVANGKCANAGTPINKENAFKQRATDADIAIARKRKQRRGRKEFRGYTCCICGAWFESHNERKSHEREMHLGTDKYKCKYCDNTFRTAVERQIHEEGDQSLYDWNVEDINAYKESPNEGKDNVTNQNDNEKFSDYTTDKIDLMAGIDQPDPLEISPTAAQLDKYPCRLCDRLYKHERSLTSHYIRIHKFKGDYKCTFCNEQFLQEWCKNMHEKSVHSNEISYICKYCGKGITNVYSLKRHEKNHEVTKVKVKCPKCEKTLPRRRLKVHMLCHNTERPFKCKYCNQRYLYKHHLTRHEAVHENKRKYKCYICNRGFNVLDNLRQHKKSTHRLFLLNHPEVKQTKQNE